MNGGLLDWEPLKYLHREGKLTPSSLSRLLDERDTIIYYLFIMIASHIRRNVEA